MRERNKNIDFLRSREEL